MYYGVPATIYRSFVALTDNVLGVVEESRTLFVMQRPKSMSQIESRFVTIMLSGLISLWTMF